MDTQATGSAASPPLPLVDRAIDPRGVAVALALSSLIWAALFSLV